MARRGHGWPRRSGQGRAKPGKAGRAGRSIEIGAVGTAVRHSFSEQIWPYHTGVCPGSHSFARLKMGFLMLSPSSFSVGTGPKMEPKSGQKAPFLAVSGPWMDPRMGVARGDDGRSPDAPHTRKSGRTLLESTRRNERWTLAGRTNLAILYWS